MRLWTLHPQYLDAKGLVALWREALLAQKVLQGLTRGYKHHPQLQRFQALDNPVAGVATYLVAVWEEAQRRGYTFDDTKIAPVRCERRIEETKGQAAYEWQHLMAKLKRRDPARHQLHQRVKRPLLHPLFCLIPGTVRAWERR